MLGVKKPREFERLPNGHMASHKLLVDDFCVAAYRQEHPILEVRFTERINLPGLYAIESAKLGGVSVDVV